MKNVYKFVKWEVPEIENLASSYIYKVMEKLNNGEKLTRNEKNCVTGSTDYRGWRFDFHPYCKRYLAFVNGYGWREYYGYDKTAVKNAHHGITEIYEIPKRG